MDKISRGYDFTPEFREMEEGEVASRIGGHASVFDTPTLIGTRTHGYIESIARGAFDDVLGDDVVLTIDHAGLPLARTSSGTLRLSVDDVGLVFEGDIADTTAGRDALVLVGRGDLNQASFAFTIKGEEWRTFESEGSPLDGMDYRIINKVERMYDVTLATFGAYSTTDIGLRSATVSDAELAATLAGRPAQEIPVVRNDDLLLAHQRAAFRYSFMKGNS